MVVFESKNTRGEWLEDRNVVFKIVNGFIKGQELKDVFNKSLEAMIKHNSQKWLSDNSHVKPYLPEDSAWIKETWFPNAVKTSKWKYYGVVQPEDLLGKMQRGRNYSYYRENGIELQTFETIEQALAWLDSQK